MRIFIFTLLIFFVQNGWTQTQQPTLRQIAVTGSAEMTIPPDKITLEVTLREFGDKVHKTKLNKIENKFFNAIDKNGINRDLLTYKNSQYYWYYWWYYRNHYFRQVSYLVTLDKSTDFMKLMKDLNFEGIYNVKIDNSSSESIQEMRKLVKINALKAAKEKATYLLESIDESLGKIVTIEELENNNNYYWRQNQLISNVVVDNPNSSEDSNLGIPSIKLRYEVKTVFEIL